MFERQSLVTSRLFGQHSPNRSRVIRSFAGRSLTLPRSRIREFAQGTKTISATVDTFLKTDTDWDQSPLSKRPDWLLANLFFASLTPHFQAELLDKHAALIPADMLQTWKFTPLISACLEIESSPKFKLDASSRKAQGKVGGVHEDKRGKRDKRDKKPDGKKSTPSRKQIMGDDGLPRITMGSLTTEQRMEARKAMNEARKTKTRVADFEWAVSNVQNWRRLR